MCQSGCVSALKAWSSRSSAGVVVTLVELERRVLLAGDTPGTVLRSTLAQGKGEGATVLVIEAKHQPVSAFLSFDNSLSSALGRTTMGAGVDFNSVAGFGEMVYLRVNGHPEQGGSNGFFDRYPTNRGLAAGVIVPMWVDGLTFNAEVTDARTTPRVNQGLQTTDTFQRLSLRLRYNWLRGRAANFNSELAFDAQDEVQSLFVASDPVDLSQDRLRIVRFTNDGDVLTPWGAAISGRVTGSFGLNAFGARSAADATALLPLSRQGADAAFQKVDVAVGYSHLLLDHLAVQFTARAQTSFGQALARSEQIGIANTSGLSGFDAGSIVGDQGYVTRAELSSPWTLPLPTTAMRVVAAPYVFGAYGAVTLEKPTILEAGAYFRHLLRRRRAVRRRRVWRAVEWLADIRIRPRNAQRRCRRGGSFLDRLVGSILESRNSLMMRRPARLRQNHSSRRDGSRRGLLLATTALTSSLLIGPALAQNLPTGGSVAAGSVTIAAPTSTQLNITQASQSAVVNWQSFSVGQGSAVNIQQPNSTAALLNRVTGDTPSTIAGSITSNGQVYLVNPNGIAITSTGIVNTGGGFVASTLGISDADFQSGKRSFHRQRRVGRQSAMPASSPSAAAAMPR